MIGVFHPGSSLVHRAPALLKLGLLAVTVTVIAMQSSAIALAVASGLVAVLFLVAWLPIALVWRQIVPILWLLAFAVPVQVIFGGWEAAATMAVRLVLAVPVAAIRYGTGSGSVPTAHWIQASNVAPISAAQR